jgi:hypothetical protein
MAKMYFAEVRDIDDPLQAGRCRIRLYSHMDDEQNIKDEHLPWAMPLLPITDGPSTGKMGKVPVGPIVGSRVVVVYMDDDIAEQYPVMIGTFQRSSLPNGG